MEMLMLDIFSLLSYLKDVWMGLYSMYNKWLVASDVLKGRGKLKLSPMIYHHHSSFTINTCEQFTSGVANTGDKSMTSVADKDDKFMTGVVDTG